MASYWQFTAVVALVVWVHFVPTGDYEAPIEAIYGNPLACLLALVVLMGLVTLAIAAIRSLRSAERP